MSQGQRPRNPRPPLTLASTGAADPSLLQDAAADAIGFLSDFAPGPSADARIPAAVADPHDPAEQVTEPSRARTSFDDISEAAKRELAERAEIAREYAEALASRRITKDRARAIIDASWSNKLYSERVEIAPQVYLTLKQPIASARHMIAARTDAASGSGNMAAAHASQVEYVLWYVRSVENQRTGRTVVIPDPNGPVHAISSEEKTAARREARAILLDSFSSEAFIRLYAEASRFALDIDCVLGTRGCVEFFS